MKGFNGYLETFYHKMETICMKVTHKLVHFFSYMQKMESKLDTICDKLDSIESRVSTLEQNPPVLVPCPASGCSSCETSSEGKKTESTKPS